MKYLFIGLVIAEVTAGAATWHFAPAGDAPITLTFSGPSSIRTVPFINGWTCKNTGNNEYQCFKSYQSKDTK